MVRTTEHRLLSAMEVCVLLDISIYTLNKWYVFKKENPDNEYAQLLPEITYKTTGNTSRKPRYWNQDDVWKLMEFKSNIKKGCGGFMGEVSHKYRKKKEE